MAFSDILQRVRRLRRPPPPPVRPAAPPPAYDVRDFDDPVPCLWSKGMARFCDFRGPEDYWLAPTESVQDAAMFRTHYAGAHGLVWVRLSTQHRDGRTADLDHFVRTALPTITRPFVLLTSDGDVSVPGELPPATVRALLGSPWLRAWYTQNHDGGGGPRLRPLPIGLDLHTPRAGSSPRRLLQALEQIAGARPPVEQAPLRVFCDIGLSLASRDRVQAVRALRGCPHVAMQQQRVSQDEIWRRYAGHPFVLSLRGNALDCHRTWEALYLGSIVITKASSLDPLFDGLPVVSVTRWQEIRDPRNLERWRQQHADRTRKPYIWERLRAQAYLQGLRRAHLDGATAPAAP